MVRANAIAAVQMKMAQREDELARLTDRAEH